MNFQLYSSLVLLLVCFSDAHPAFQHQFHRVLNEQPCLKKCFDAVAQADLELNFLKVANISGYLLNLDKICDIISSSKECISSCGEKSNPFMLRSMTAMCTPEVHAEVQSIAQCLYDEGDEIFDACRNSCGDYEAINGQVSDLTQAMRSSPNDPAKMAEIMTKTNEACATLKCSDRCSIGLYTEQCTTSDGRDAGAIIRSLIERVLVAQRHDLDSMQLADTMAQTMPAQCNYMYMPEVMFNSTKDELAQLAIDDAIRHEKSQKTAELKQHAEKAAHDEVPLTLTQIQARILRKQLQLLDIQEKNAYREAQKLDMEMELLRNKQISL